MDSNDFMGFDIDWFAIDKDGNIGIFSSAGELAIPLSAAIHHDQHRMISKQFDLPNFGSPGIWNDYVTYGLFVYDYKIYGGPYQKQASPSRLMEALLRSRILQLKDLPVIDKFFALEDSVEIPTLKFP